MARASAAIMLVASAGCWLLTDLGGLSGGVVPDGGGEDVVPNEAGIDSPSIVGEAASDAPVEAAIDSGSSYANEVLTDHPVAYFRLGDAANVARNELPSGDGRFAGAAAVGAPGLVAGDPDTAVRLEGNGRITLPIVPGLFIGQAPFSIEAWRIALDLTDGPLPTQWIVGREDVTNPRNGVSFLVDSSGVALERWVNEGASRVTGPSAHKAAPSHVVSTFDGTRTEVWVDDTPSGPGLSPQNVPDNAYPVVAGAQSSPATAFFRGVIDEIALYDRAPSRPDRRALARRKSALSVSDAGWDRRSRR